MNKINNIEYNNEYVEIESSDKYIYKIPNNNSYVRDLLYKGISMNKELNKYIKYYDKCADICMYPIWVSLGFVLYALATNFILLDMVLIACGGITALSLVGTNVFKLASKNLKEKANNNEYFTKIYEYALSGGKTKENKRKESLRNVRSNEYSKSKKQIIQDEPIRRNQNIQNNLGKSNYSGYHLNKSQIIQDEEIHQRKR